MNQKLGKSDTKAMEPLVSLAEKKQPKSFYINYSLLRKNRKEKLEQTEGLCEICGQMAQEIHHLDRSIDNHDLENLLSVCRACHKRLHSIDLGRPNKFKFRGRNYTMTEIAEISGVSNVTVNRFCEDPSHINVKTFIKIIKAIRKLEEEQMAYEGLMTVEEVADYLRCDKESIRRKVATDSIPYLKFPTRRGGVRFRKEDIDSWLIERKAKVEKGQ